MGSKFECLVSADLFRRAQAAMSTEETRYYLNGVQVEPCEQGGVLLISTDGYRLIVLHDAKGYASEGGGIVSLNKDMTKALAAKAWKLPSWMGSLTGKGPKARFVAVRGDRAAVVEHALPESGEIDREPLLAMADNPTPLVGAYQWIGVLIDGQYPDWRRVIGKPALGNAPGYVNMKLVGPIATALEGATPDGSRGPSGVRLVPTEGDDSGDQPIYILPLDAGVVGFGVIMPVRNSGQAKVNPRLPSWVERRAPKAEAA